MNVRTVTLQLPENLYLRLQQAAKSTKQSLNEVFMHAVQLGSPPDWNDVPAEFQADVAALDRLDDAALWRIARQKHSNLDMDAYQELLDKRANGSISEAEARTLDLLRMEADRFVIRKAHAVSLLHWRGHQIPPSDRL